jgi:hypothetical protein
MQRFAGPITIAVVLLFALSAAAQESPSGQAGGTNAPDHTTTVRGCLRGSRGNYVLTEDQTNLAYVLKGVGNKLDHQLHHEVEVKGTILPGTIKTGIRPEKSGSNPSDTVHGVDGVPLRVANLQTDIHTISNKCKAADEQ